MKLTLLALLMLLPVAYSLEIGLTVDNIFYVDVLHFSYNDSTSTKVFSTELVNTGSLAYDVQARVDVFDERGTAFTGWAEKKRLMPGNNGFFRIYWLPEESGNYSARLRVYYSGETADLWKNITATKIDAESVFEIGDVHVLDKFIELSVKGPAKAGRIAIVPVNYPYGWTFVQGLSEPGRVLISYNAPGLDKKSIDIYAAAENGGYATKKTIEMKKDGGLRADIMNLLLSVTRG